MPIISTSLSRNSAAPADSGNNGEQDQENSSAFSSAPLFLDRISGSPLSVGLIDYCAGKRAFEQQLDVGLGNGDDCVGDPRRRRLMKNRESATRSRARKQAFMNELKVEVDRLEEENLKLKRQCEELKSALAAAYVPTKKLRRTSSALF